MKDTGGTPFLLGIIIGVVLLIIAGSASHLILRQSDLLVVKPEPRFFVAPPNDPLCMAYMEWTRQSHQRVDGMEIICHNNH